MQKPNILWICTDQQRWDTIHSLNNDVINTPRIDGLVRESPLPTLTLPALSVHPAG